MEHRLEHMAPDDIERRSMEIISQEMGNVTLESGELAVLKRVIHTTADFDYVQNLVFSSRAVEEAVAAIRLGCTFVTDTNMARSGINQAALTKTSSQAVCYMSDPLVAKAAKASRTTRACASMDRAAQLSGPLIVAVGNAPTALIRLCELIQSGKIAPKLVIGAPVGFVNVVESKELLLSTPVPQIVARGRKGGSGVAAAICNALLYLATGRSL